MARLPGRPRDPAVDRAILGAAVRLLTEQGYDSMSIDGVAAAAGVGRTTVYRRYPGKRELVVAAISSIASSMEPIADSGTALGDLRSLMRQTMAVFRRDGLGFAMLGTLLVREREDPALLELFRERVILPRLELASEIVRRGVARGEVRPDAPAEVMAHALQGSMFAGHILGRELDDAWLESVLAVIWEGIAARPAPPGGGAGPKPGGP
ncbi:MAG: TetR/AcrR family transcriptional regulator [Chloroflexi bacterium]|nr:TetR/AcrR family transcriptional regulator [Chloroflexota bacterium]